MKKLRIVFAILLTLVLVCAAAFAEEDITVEESELVAADTETNTEVVDTTKPDGTGDGDNHEENINTGTTATYQLHTGENRPSDDDIVTAAAGVAKGGKFTVNGIEFEVIQVYSCKTGTSGLYRFPCQLGLETETGDPIWHECVIAASHKWASEQHELGNDWGKNVTEASCTEKGKAQDYCLVCGTERDNFREIAPMGHSFAHEDDARIELVVSVEPSCLNNTNGTAKKDGKIQFKCVVCGAVLTYVKADNKTYDYVEIDRNDLIALRDGTALTNSPSLNDFLTELQNPNSTKIKTTYTYAFKWFNKEAFQVKYHTWQSHKWDKWITDKKATCSSNGQEVRYCKVCATKVSRPTPALTADYQLDTSKTQILDCYHEAQVWVCQNCKGAALNHPNIIKVRKVSAHTIDTRVKAIIDAAVADPEVTAYTYKGHKVYQAATCEKAGYVYYLCAHENDDAVQLTEASILAAYKAKATTQTLGGNTVYTTSDNTKWIMWTGADLFIGAEITYDEETESFPVLEKDIWLTGTYTFKTTDHGENYTLVSKDLDDIDLKKYYEYDNLEWSSESYVADILTKYSHATDTTAVANEKGFYINTNTGADSYFGETIKALGHDWSEWIQRYKVDEGGAGNEYAYFIRSCKRCGQVQELVGTKTPTCDDTKETHDYQVFQVTEPTCTTKGQTISKCSKCSDLKVTAETPALGHKEVVIPAVAPTTTSTGLTEGIKCERCGEIIKAQEVIAKLDVVENKYSMDIKGVTKSATTTDGTGTIAKLEGNEDVGSLYVRIYWVYTLSDGSSMAYAAVKPVTVTDDGMTFDTTSPSAPYGATLDEVQFALVGDAKADRSPIYTSVGGTKPIVLGE